ncbi:alpha/beta fold hydrolase [Maricaulis sp.]|uniref:S9 family peptidase n=1 Tax=Maricaulis sp. TaxID=1486257 RepID=UPI0025BA6A74|nr:alpha/beta fold hydrolase [Maricaulis sp.]
MSRFNPRSLLVAVAVGLISAGSCLAQALPAVSAFSRTPHASLVALSPDGSRIAFVTNDTGGNLILLAAHLASGERRISNISGLVPHTVLWADNDSLVMVASQSGRLPYLEGMVDFTAAFGFEINNGFEPVRLMSRQNSSGGIGSNLGEEGNTGLDLNRGRIAGRVPSTGEVMIAINSVSRQRDLHRASPGSRRSTLVHEGGASTVRFFLDRDGQAVARMDYDAVGDYQSIRVLRGGNWEEVFALEDSRIEGLEVYGLLPSGDLAVGYYMDDHLSVLPLSLETGVIGAPIFQNQQFDHSRIICDPHSNLVRGVEVEAQTPTQVWFNAGIDQLRGQLEAALGGVPTTIETWSSDFTKILVATHPANGPTVYYYFDGETGALSQFANSHPDLADVQLPAREPYSYAARDGTPIPGYLTRAAGAGPQPTIILIHSGPQSHGSLLVHGQPEARANGRFDYWAHFLGSRGYTVLQPNFRGSDGYGYAWARAGDGQWGRLMQQDISDGVNALTEAGLADPDRICIVGASYGGYAALAGATLTPDLYACAAAFAPVTDLPAMLGFIDRRTGLSSAMQAGFRRSILGENDLLSFTEADNVSPRHLAPDLSIPVLILHGESDSVVPIEQSVFFNNAARDRDLVTFIRLEDGDHWLTQPQTRETLLTELERFLAEHLGEE